MCTFMLMISDISETWVPPHGHPGFSPNLKTRGVLPCKVSKHRNLSLIYTSRSEHSIVELFAIHFHRLANWIPI